MQIREQKIWFLFTNTFDRSQIENSCKGRRVSYKSCIATKEIPLELERR